MIATIRCKWDHQILSDYDQVELLRLRNPWVEVGGQRVMGPNPPVYVHWGEGIKLARDYSLFDQGSLVVLQRKAP